MRDALADLLQGEAQYAAVVDHDGRIDGVLSVEIISEFLASPAGEDRGAQRRGAPPWLARRCCWRRSGKSAKASSTNAAPERCPARRSRATSSAGTGRGKTSTATGRRPLQQLELVVISVVLGFAVAFALALLAHRRRWLRPPLLAGTGILYAIPSIAFFLLLLPITGRGRDTAIIALSAYTLQIIYRNVTVGLDNVPESAKDSARGMGMTERQILWRVELPLATPEIIGGLRIATVSTIAIATLAVFAGAGGLGTQILGEAQPPLPDHDHHRRRDRDRDGARLRRDPADHPVPRDALATGEGIVSLADPAVRLLRRRDRIHLHAADLERHRRQDRRRPRPGDRTDPRPSSK